MSGKKLIPIMAFLVVVCGFGFFYMFKMAYSQRGLVTEELSKEFVDYEKTFKHLDFIAVGESKDIQYKVTLNTPWKFEIHDQTLMVYPPALTPGNPPDPAALTTAKDIIKEAVFVWIEDKFHTRNKFAVEISL